MAFQALFYLSSIILAYVAWTSFQLLANYRIAKRMGLRIIVSPVSPFNPLWLLTRPLFEPILKILPFGLGSWAYYITMGWTFYDRFQAHAELGKAFVVCSPSSVEVYLADPGATDEVQRRRNDFIKDPAVYGMLDIYGPNLDTVNGKVWEKHRRITVPPFNEQNSALVWAETAEQANQMLKVWQSKSKVTTTQQDSYHLALNVLCAAGFGLRNSYIDDKSVVDSKTGGKLGYRESLSTILSNFVLLILLAGIKKVNLPESFLWGSLKKTLTAFHEFKTYMAEMLVLEKTAYEQGDLDRHNLMSALVRASEQAKHTQTANGTTNKTLGLTDEEVYGNLFIYNLAGQDTTAATIHFALVLLAVNPELQEWIAEEVDEVRASESVSSWAYESTFPKLKRCLALMYETLRLYGPVVQMPRKVDSAQTLQIGDKQVVIPSQTSITVNFAGLHSDPESWGPDPINFRPSRWFEHSQGDGKPSIFEPKAGSFIPWNGGPRVCPGRKFSQVEFVGVMFALFSSRSRVELVKEGNETDEQLKRRVMKIVNQATVEVTLKMRNSERIALKWVRK